jgi:hypothetical protein
MINVPSIRPPTFGGIMAIENGANKEMSARLLARLAAAADGHRKKKVFFVARYTPNENSFDISKGFADESELTEEWKAKLSTGEYGWFGPYRTDDGTSDKIKVKSILIRTKDDTGDSTIELKDASEFDAIFWSLSTVEKFAIPYYTSLYGPAYADELRKRFLADDLYLMVHLPGSEPENTPTAAMVRQNPLTGKTEISPVTLPT